jgi:addiction module HigA family antidote
MSKKLSPIHPGEILLEEFLKPLGLSHAEVANDIGVPTGRIHEIIRSRRSISAETALRLSRYFGLSDRFWLNLQARYDLEVEKDRLEGRLRREVKVLDRSRMSKVVA